MGTLFDKRQVVARFKSNRLSSVAEESSSWELLHAWCQSCGGGSCCAWWHRASKLGVKLCKIIKTGEFEGGGEVWGAENAPGGCQGPVLGSEGAACRTRQRSHWESHLSELWRTRCACWSFVSCCCCWCRCCRGDYRPICCLFLPRKHSHPLPHSGFLLQFPPHLPPLDHGRPVVDQDKAGPDLLGLEQLGKLLLLVVHNCARFH